jgi:hypothetical protein
VERDRVLLMCQDTISSQFFGFVLRHSLLVHPSGNAMLASRVGGRGGNCTPSLLLGGANYAERTR